MEQYSRETRVELTSLGWLYVADRRLGDLSKSRSKDTQRKLMRRAKAALSSARLEIEAGEVLREAR